MPWIIVRILLLVPFTPVRQDIGDEDRDETDQAHGTNCLGRSEERAKQQNELGAVRDQRA